MEQPIEEQPAAEAEPRSLETVEPVPVVTEAQEEQTPAEVQQPEADVQEREVQKEAEPISTEPVEVKEPETAPEAAPSEPTEAAVTAPSEPEPQHMSAKAKKKAKKDKKRQSKNLEATPADAAPDSEVKDNEVQQTPETAPPVPAGISSEQKGDEAVVPELVPLPEGDDVLEEKDIAKEAPAPSAEEARSADSAPLPPDIGSEQAYKLQGADAGTRELESTTTTTTTGPQDPEIDNPEQQPAGDGDAEQADNKTTTRSVAEAVLGMPRRMGRVSSFFPDLKRSGFRKTPSNESVKDRAEDETREPEVSRDLDDENESAIRVSEAPITSLPTPGDDHSTSMVGPAESDAARTTTTSRGIDVDAVPDQQEEGEKGDEEKNMQQQEKVEEENYSQRPSAPSPTPTTSTIRQVSPELRRSPTVKHGSHEPTPRSWSLDDDDPSKQERSVPGPAGEPQQQEQARTMGSPAGTTRLEMKPEHVLQPQPQTPTRTASDQQHEPVKTPSRSVSQPRPAGANPTPDSQQMRRPGSMGSLPTATTAMATTMRSRNNSVVQLQSPRTPQRQPTSSNSSIGSSPAGSMPRGLRRTGPASRTPSNDLRSASRALEGAKKPPQPPEFPPADVNLEHIASSSSYDPVTDKGKRPVRGMSDVIVSIS